MLKLPLNYFSRGKSWIDENVSRNDQVSIAFGILGFVLVYTHFPFEWSLPDYALY